MISINEILIKYYAVINIYYIKNIANIIDHTDFG